MRKVKAGKEVTAMWRIALNLLIIIAVSVCFYFTYTGGGDALLATGISGLKYFTVLSNIFAALAAVFWIISHNTGKLYRAAEAVKFVSAVSVALTFTTVVVFLGPLYGYPKMFTGPNLWYHLIVPIAAMLEIILFQEHVPSLRLCALSVVSPLLYGTAYAVNILANGTGTPPTTNDWYGFVTWGIPIGLVIFIAICAVTFGLACLLRLLNRFFCVTERDAIDTDRNPDVSAYRPELSDMRFRRDLLADEDTMSYNHAWGGTVQFPEEDWKEWYDLWVGGGDGQRYYRYLKNENGDFIGEMAYHYDEELSGYIADVIIHSKYRGLGYGGRALDLLCSAAKENGISVMYDDIASDNPATVLFKKHGFTEESRTEEKIILKKIL